MTDSKTLAIVFGLVALVAIVAVYSVRGVKLFAQAIAFAEGFGVPGAIPTVRNNPGDLKLPRDGGSITTFPTIAEGWAALYRQLQLIVDGRSSFYSLSMTIDQMARIYTATEQNAWSQNVVNYLRSHGRPDVTGSTTLRAVLA